MNASFAVLGFRNPDRTLGFALTSQPLSYIDRLRTGVYTSKWIDCDANWAWVVPARSHLEAKALRDRWNESPPIRAASEASKFSAPAEIIDELLELGADEHAAELEGSQTGGEAIRALELIRFHGEFADLEGTYQPAPDDRTRAEDCPFIPLAKPIGGQKNFGVGNTHLGFKLAIFDLDGTLVNSSSLQKLRDAGDWGEVFRRVDEVRPLSCWNGCPPHQLPRFFHELGVHVVVISRANRKYVDAVIQLFDIHSDSVCAPSGPNKIEAFERAMRRFGATPDQTVVFGDDKSDFVAAAHYRALSLGNPWVFKSNAAVAPDIAWLDAALLLEQGDWSRRLRYIGEVDQTSARWHRGSLLSYADDSFTLGRYFTKLRDAPRHWEHPLSRGILVGKKNPDGDPHVREAFQTAVRHLAERIKIDAVISVPPYVDQPDRFVPFRQIVAGSTGSEMVIGRQTHVQKGPGRFEIDEDLGGQTVLLLDDVVTKGGTLDDLRHAAKEAGAGRTVQLAFGFTQNFDL